MPPVLAHGPHRDRPASCFERIGESLSAAVRFLLAQQAPDGAWRSETYGAFKDGDALTPLVLHTLLALPPAEEIAAHARQGQDYLAALASLSATAAGPHGLNYPVYTAALAVVVLAQAGIAEHEEARAWWLSYLKERQLTEDLGWHPADRAYGGWGYCSGLPRKPEPGELAAPYTEANLSATVFALEALRTAEPANEDPAFARALCFVRRCQNFEDDAGALDQAFDDGGFFFIHDDPVRNKAGAAGTDRNGKQRFHSYGSTTADGLRALLACGLQPDNPRVAAARQWLERNFSVASHPGKFAAARQAIQAAVYFYYCWSLAHALAATGTQALATPAGPVCWAEALAAALMERQQPDGSWINDAVEVREDDPIVATSLAVGALAVCQKLDRRVRSSVT